LDYIEIYETENQNQPNLIGVLIAELQFQGGTG